jgi:uncharacterized protein YeaO (DUF488 family)
MTVTANIDISTPTGRKIVRELEKHKRVVELIYNEPLPSEEVVSWEAAEEYLWDKLKDHYGADLRSL